MERDMSSSVQTSPDLTPAARALLSRRSFRELDARERAFALLDAGTGREFCDPFDRIESPWLEPQGLVPEADDGVVLVKGTLAGEACVVIGIEGAFQGGGIGEVCGAKAAFALRLAARDSRAGQPVSAVLLLETGGVRLQEATLGLNAVAEVLSAILELRGLRPVVGIVAGPLGSFGGMSIAAGLCSRIVLTHEGRLGFDGPEVIESEAGVAEFDSSDHALVWSINGGAHRYTQGLADALVLDDVPAVRQAVITAIAAGVPGRHRSEELDVLTARLSGDDSHPAPFGLPSLGIPPAAAPGSSLQDRGAVS
jgi:malonate decarboxylase beta subunit